MINTWIISNLQYNAAFLPSPLIKIIQQINKPICNFLWSKKDRIKRKTLIGKENKGAIYIIDLESKLNASKASWVPRLTTRKAVLLNYCRKKLTQEYMYILKTN